MSSTNPPIETGRRRRTPLGVSDAGKQTATKPAIDAVSIMAWLLFSAATLLVWVSVTPFRDLSSDTLLQATGSGNILNQVGYSVLGASMVAFTALTNPGLFKILMRGTYGMTIAWFALSAFGAQEQLLSLKRLVLTCIVIVVAAMMLTLPASMRNFAEWLGGLTAFVLALCYFGIVFAPGVSIHNEFDVAEPGLAGNWRGLFPHKNLAGSMMVIFAFIGLFVAQVRSAMLGWTIVVASVVFLYFTAAKTSMLLLPVVLMLALICERVRKSSLRAIVALALLATVSLATIGAATSPAIKSAVDQLLPDASFTGRTDIWAFAVDKIRERPVFGFGFAAFWRTNHVMFDNNDVDERDEQLYLNVNQATSAHNGYLDIALQTGLVGLFLTLAWVVVLPLKDFARVWDDPASRELGHLFFRIWLFGINSSCLESALFDPVGPPWFMMLMSMFGLRLMSRYRVSP